MLDNKCLFIVEVFTFYKIDLPYKKLKLMRIATVNDVKFIHMVSK